MPARSGLKASLTTVAAITLLTAQAVAQDHPQEVLELISAHQALAMKIRPLQDRVQAAAPQAGSAAFQPEGVPIRAKADTSGEGENQAAESRVSERLRHKDRAVNDGDDYGRIKVRLSALEQKASAERERINRPGFGAGLEPREDESGGVRFGDGRVGARPGTQAPAPAGTTMRAAQSADPAAIAGARKALAELQGEYLALEREVKALEQQ